MNWKEKFSNPHKTKANFSEVKEEINKHETAEEKQVNKPISVQQIEILSEEELHRARSSSFSFRDDVVDGLDNFEKNKSFYLPVMTELAIKLKVLIPEIAARKLMKFDSSAVIGVIIDVMVLKHRFAEGSYELYRRTDSGDQYLEPDKTIEFYNLKDMEEIELRKKGASKPEMKPEERLDESTMQFSEALPPQGQNLTSASEEKDEENSILEGNGNDSSPKWNGPSLVSATEALTFKLEFKAWEPLAIQRLKVEVQCYAPNQFKVIVLSATSESLVSAQLTPLISFTRASKTFCYFSVIMDDQTVSCYGMSFQLDETAHLFSTIVLSCLEKNQNRGTEQQQEEAIKLKADIPPPIPTRF